MKKNNLDIGFLFFIFLIASCKKNTTAPIPSIPDTIVKPTGVFSSAGSTATAVLNHSETRGVLIRAFWKDIESTEGVFNFTLLENQINAVKSKGKKIFPFYSCWWYW